MNPFVVGISNIFWTKYGIDSKMKKYPGTIKTEHWEQSKVYFLGEN